MARPRTKSFDFAKGIYYFKINKGYKNDITIKRTNKQEAILAYQSYLKTQKDSCKWLGKWDGKNWLESDFDELVKNS